ncbi:MAG: FAD-binding protein [Desulfuromusa sp.]|nr:FAD-binding protein [Desulfuromusa sp.]
MTELKRKKEVSRRNFMAIAGSAAGLAAMASMGVFAGDPELKGNIPEIDIDIDTMTREEMETDLLVIGSGIAGLFAAVKGHDAGAKVLMVSKGRLGSSGQTPFAKGIFAYDPDKEKLSLDEFVATVSRSAMGTNNPVFTRQMAEHSLARVKDLKEWGFFDSPLYFNSFSKPLEERNIPVVERVMITHLIKENGKIAGAAGFSFDEAKVYIFKAKSVVLCSGAGGFKPNGFPICDLTHDGTVMAYSIGAKVTGKEWNDGHSGQPTNAAACYDGWHGMFDRKPGLTGVEVHHDLGVEQCYQAYMGGGPLAGGPPGQSGGKQVTGGPVRPAEFAENGRRPSPPPGGKGKEGGGPPPGGGPDSGGAPPPGMMGGSSVCGTSAGMSIHKSEGLVPINDQGASNIPGLYAAGDALGSYMAGAIYTQVGSSLAGSAVQGAIVSEAAAEYCKGMKLPTISKNKIKAIEEEILAPLKREKGYSPAWVTQTLQGIMIPNFVLYIKKESMLKAALAYIEELRDHHLPMLRAADLHELRLAHETANMIVNAEMKLKASLLRKESRCSHYRLDYPDVDSKNWNAWINIYKGNNGEMKFEKQPFSSWPS